MIYVKILSTSSDTAVFCELRDHSLAEMREMDASFCMGWVIAALGRWIARSNLPGSNRVETNAILESLQVHLPNFTDSDLIQLFELPCLTSRSQYLNQKAQDHLGHAINRDQFTMGWGYFQNFDSRKAVADAEAINLHTEKSKAHATPWYP